MTRFAGWSLVFLFAAFLAGCDLLSPDDDNGKVEDVEGTWAIQIQDTGFADFTNTFYLENGDVQVQAGEDNGNYSVNGDQITMDVNIVGVDYDFTGTLSQTGDVRHMNGTVVETYDGQTYPGTFDGTWQYAEKPPHLR